MNPNDLIAAKQRVNQAMQGAPPTPLGYRESTPRERAQLAVTQAEERLADAKRVMAIFDEHPALEELLTLLQRHGNF